MEQNIVVYIGIWKALTLVAAVVAGAWYAAYRLGRVESQVEGFEKRLTSMEGRLDSMEGRLDHAFENSSPIALLAKGKTILHDSGLKNYIDENTDSLLEDCRMKNAMVSSYDIQNAAFKYFADMEFSLEIDKSTKDAAFRHGVSVETVRRVGGIYFRDLCLEKSGYKREDLDGPTVPVS